MSLKLLHWFFSIFILRWVKASQSDKTRRNKENKQNEDAISQGTSVQIWCVSIVENSRFFYFRMVMLFPLKLF